ncbi:hypothetical protein [Kribbella sp. DT2]|uniref:hypothetical protein n=1 Tax=Kribbella sp. DT2 TaxID=3393427 RepID=UPI003CE73235
MAVTEHVRVLLGRAGAGVNFFGLGCVVLGSPYGGPSGGGGPRGTGRLVYHVLPRSRPSR